MADIWFLPDNSAGTDADWHDWALAYDGNPATYAWSDKDYFGFTYSARTGWFYVNAAELVVCTKLYFDMKCQTSSGVPPYLELYLINPDDSWTLIYWARWNVSPVEFSFSERTIKGAVGRIRAVVFEPPYRWLSGTVHETKFWGEPVSGWGTIPTHCLDQHDDPVAGAEIDLLNSGSVIVDTQTSGVDGIATFENLPADTYTVDVTSVPNGYELDSTSEAIAVELGQTVDAYNYFDRIGAPRTYFFLA